VIAVIPRNLAQRALQLEQNLIKLNRTLRH
jgi:hypothetical protein